jgi:hypothetical protein
VAPGLQSTDNLRWRLLKRRLLIKLEEPVDPDADRVRIVVPYLDSCATPCAGAAAAEGAQAGRRAVRR